MKKFTIAILLIAATLMISVPVKVQAAIGWQKIDGYWYYYYNDSGYYKNDWYEIGESGKAYYFDASGRMQTGWIQAEHGWYYANSKGELQKGWQYIGDKWYYFSLSNYYMYANWRYEIDGKSYFFYKSGAMATGWCVYSKAGEDAWYYADNKGVLQTGWQKINGKWYYFHEILCLMLSGGFEHIDGKMYFFSDSGAMKTGWIKSGEYWYYANGSGEVVTGWQKINGKWYYFEPGSAFMTADTFRIIDGKMYFFDSSGAMKTGWIKHTYTIDGNTYTEWLYAGSDGAMVSGWHKINSIWYYFSPTGYEMFSRGRYEIDGSWYFFDDSGAMKTGWCKSGEYWYYAESNGKLVTEWQKINGKWYYFDPESYAMISGGFRKIGSDAYFFADSGAMMYGWCNYKYTFAGNTYSFWYYAGSGGRLVTGWKEINGVNYYFDPTDYFLVTSE